MICCTKWLPMVEVRLESEPDRCRLGKLSAKTGRTPRYRLQLLSTVRSALLSVRPCFCPQGLLSWLTQVPPGLEQCPLSAYLPSGSRAQGLLSLFSIRKQRTHPTDLIFYLLSAQTPCLLLTLRTGFLPCAFYPSFPLPITCLNQSEHMGTLFTPLELWSLQSYPVSSFLTPHGNRAQKGEKAQLAGQLP